MPTVPLTAIMYHADSKHTSFKDMTGEIRIEGYSMEILASALTQQEWLALKSAVQQPYTWVKITSTMDQR